MVFAVIENMSVGESLLISLVGFTIVFVALIVLMGLIKLITVVSVALSGGGTIEQAAVAAPAPSPVAAANAIPAGMVPAKGSLGEIKLNDVDDKTAALIMAIVADELKAPLNELRFKSIRTK